MDQSPVFLFVSTKESLIRYNILFGECLQNPAFLCHVSSMSTNRSGRLKKINLCENLYLLMFAKNFKLFWIYDICSIIKKYIFCSLDIYSRFHTLNFYSQTETLKNLKTFFPLPWQRSTTVISYQNHLSTIYLSLIKNARMICECFK